TLSNEILLNISYSLPLGDQHSLLLTNSRLSSLLKHVLIDTVFVTLNTIKGRILMTTLALQNDTSGIEALIAQGILTFIGSPGTIINWAIETQSEAVLQALLDCRISAVLPDYCGRKPLVLAARSGKVGMVKILLSKKEYDIDINTLERSGNNGEESPLGAAIGAGHIKVVQLLLEYSDINVNEHKITLNSENTSIPNL